jgi:FkbM family methyltransferase
MSFNNKMEYYSQVGQDKYLNEFIFFSKQKGFFVEIGANNGVLFSNTLFFEKELNWNGLCIEANPIVFKDLSKNRKVICENCAISDNNGFAIFNKIEGYGEQLSGLVLKYNERHIQRIKKTIQEFGGTEEKIEIPTYTLNTILDKHNCSKIDFISIDTEGGELDLIKLINFKKYDIKVIIVENNYNNGDIYDYITNKGYKLIKRLEMDEIYLKRNPILAFLANIKRSIIK